MEERIREVRWKETVSQRSKISKERRQRKIKQSRGKEAKKEDKERSKAKEEKKDGSPDARLNS